jgi:hypothetical protein
MRAFTMFYSYFNMQANLLGTEFAKATQKQGLRKGAGRMLYLYSMGFMIPAVLSELLVRSMSGDGWDEDDDGSYLNDIMSIFFGSQFRAGSAMIPVVGSTAQAGVNLWNNKAYDDRISTSPAITMVEGSLRAPKSTYNWVKNGDGGSRAIRDWLTLMSLMTGAPVAPFGKPIGYIMDVSEGKAQPKGGLDYARGLITGKKGSK